MWNTVTGGTNINEVDYLLYRTFFLFNAIREETKRKLLCYTFVDIRRPCLYSQRALVRWGTEVRWDVLRSLLGCSHYSNVSQICLTGLRSGLCRGPSSSSVPISANQRHCQSRTGLSFIVKVKGNYNATAYKGILHNCVLEMEKGHLVSFVMIYSVADVKAL